MKSTYVLYGGKRNLKIIKESHYKVHTIFYYSDDFNFKIEAICRKTSVGYGR